MMIARAVKFTPEVLLSAPRRSAGLPNAEGTIVLHTISTYSFQNHSKTTTLRALNVKSGESIELAKDQDISDLNWLDDDRFVALRREKNGHTSVIEGSVKSGTASQVAGEINAAAGNLRVTKLNVEGEYAVVLSAAADRNGNLWTPELAERKTRSTGRLYNGLFVRHWDRFEGPEHNALWYGKLTKGSNGELSLSSLTNALKGTGLESPVQPFGGTDNFDIRNDAIIFVAKDPKLNPALNTKCNVYILRIKSWTHPTDSASLRQIAIPGFEGASSSPVFAPHGPKAAFLSMKRPGYEADKNRIFVIPDVNATEINATETHGSSSGEGSWDRSPSSVSFTADAQKLLLTAENEGTGCLYITDGDITKSGDHLPIALTSNGAVSDARPLTDGRIFISGSSLIDNSWYAIVDPKAEIASSKPGCAPVGMWSHSNSGEGKKFGLSSSQISSIRTPSSNPKINKEVHSLVLKPSFYEEGKKYPVAYLIHGGPQGSWADNWSTRWNPAVYAEQGYIVVTPNPTGSTGYGQAFTDAINSNWGGDPYEDIVRVFEWVGKNMKDADNENAVALGASYGGYMINWLNGHDLGRRFKTMVNHDGIFSFAGGLLATEELYFPFHDLKGTPWDASTKSAVAKKTNEVFSSSSTSNWRKWDPSEYLSHWSTPTLIIHSEKDYRLNLSEGLAAFNVLQARGIESQFLTFPDENHWVLKPENSLVWHKVVLNWINKFTGLPAYTDEDPNGDSFWGGVVEGKEENSAMPIQGKPET
ncbi:Hypothetical protein R9X50_00520800 [Acrodontium crateriforme]|uniref:Dipeptidyl-peptidase V n=1 Tax=Acrodontium crateriforme TaxID=150365 RepID=A0AAQ3M7I8_9PEZI|nr:Hypothetical protein R9X50_00520800 [Acrodontium crateriforme]